MPARLPAWRTPALKTLAGLVGLAADERIAKALVSNLPERLATVS